MQAINTKNIEEIKMFLDEVGADMEILSYNIREYSYSEEQKIHNIKIISELRKSVYDAMKKLK